MQISQIVIKDLEYETETILRAFFSTLTVNTIDATTASVEDITFTSLPKENASRINKINVFNLDKTNFILKLINENRDILWFKLTCTASLNFDDYTPLVFDYLRKIEDQVIDYCRMGYLGFSIRHSAYSNNIEIRLAMC